MSPRLDGRNEAGLGSGRPRVERISEILASAPRPLRLGMEHRGWTLEMWVTHQWWRSPGKTELWGFDGSCAWCVS